MATVTYRNGFYHENNRNSKYYFTTDAKPIRHRGYDIYRYSNDEYHIVNPETMVCENIYSGINGAKLLLDNRKDFYCLWNAEEEVEKCKNQCAICITRTAL